MKRNCNRDAERCSESCLEDCTLTVGRYLITFIIIVIIIIIYAEITRETSFVMYVRTRATITTNDPKRDDFLLFPPLHGNGGTDLFGLETIDARGKGREGRD